LHHYQLLIFFALLIFSFGLFSRLAERKSVTGPMFFMTVGILASPLIFNLFSARPELDAVTLVAELALMLVLFTDASLIDLKVLRELPSKIPNPLSITLV
jgi:NhaP-type Na+/H+ or K+/H+ antiporter